MPQRILAPNSPTVFRVKATSSALNGSPSLQVTPERVLILSWVKSSFYSQLSASQGIVSSAKAL